MEQKSNNIVDIRYQQTGEASATDELGMREMQARLDDIVESCYPGYPFATDEARQELRIIVGHGNSMSTLL